MSIYSNIAEKLQYVSPNFYKERFFKKLKGLNRNNILERKVEPELLWIKNYLNRNDVYMDIGANVGAYLFQLENKLKPENIYAFEPNKRLCQRLKRIFPDVHSFSLALSDVNTFAEFKVPVMNGKRIHTRGTLQTNLKEEGESTSEIMKVKVIKLDDWAEIEHFNRLNFIKIDVEGNELQTLRGAEETIKKFKPTLMVEIEQRHHETPIWNIISEIEHWGFTAHFFNRNSLTLEKLTKDLIEAQNSENVKKYGEYINNIIFVPVK